jgi:protein-L-isoaspartate(D-aspartate) O-methyltransferase
MDVSLEEDSYRAKGLRKLLIDELRKKNIASEAVLNAMLNVPRHLFFPDKAFLEKAYEDIAFKIGSGQTISHPSTVAHQTTLLDPKPKEKVLEIGTGSGYQAAVLAELGMKVYSIERQHDLFVKTKQIFQKFAIPAYLTYGDGFKGITAYAPYDKIIITCGAAQLPLELMEQLNVGGIMVVPIGEGKEQIMHKIFKTSPTTWEEQTTGKFSFVPMLQNKS